MIVISNYVETVQGKTIHRDNYTKVDTHEEALKLYKEELERDDLYSCTIAEEVESTDYEPASILAKIDFKALRKQKKILMELILQEDKKDDPKVTARMNDLDGLVALLDAIQDQAVEFRYATEKQVFNFKGKKKKK